MHVSLAQAGVLSHYTHYSPQILSTISPESTPEKAAEVAVKMQPKDPFTLSFWHQPPKRPAGEPNSQHEASFWLDHGCRHRTAHHLLLLVFAQPALSQANVEGMVVEFGEYKAAIPVRGGIILDAALEQVRGGRNRGARGWGVCSLCGCMSEMLPACV